MKQRTGRFAWTPCVLAIGLILGISCGAWAAQKKKKPKSASSEDLPTMPLSDKDRINLNIGEMLGAFQVGDVEIMHKYYADDAVFVSGLYEPPVIGWQNYAALYKQERASFQAFEISRLHTLIFTHGDVAWASYQWQFDSTLGGKPYSARGQTTLVFEKVGANWLIEHNHTSEICPEAAAPQQEKPGTPAAPARPPATSAPH